MNDVLEHIPTFLARGEFPQLSRPRADQEQPTGIWGYKRLPLVELFPELGQTPLTIYYHLRIACCAYLVVEGASKLVNCPRCQNRGWVCPQCRGGRFLVDGDDGYRLVRCPGCVYERVDHKGQIFGTFDAERALATASNWLKRKFPYGVPSVPTQADLDRMRER